MTIEPKKLLTIGGSDSGGSAGIQADLKTWTALGVHGMTALTVLTAQNTTKVAGLEWVSAEFLQLQLDTILSDYGADAIKTGFLGRLDLIDVIASAIAGRPNVVIDPVLMTAQGVPLFDDSVVDAYRDKLFPIAAIVTPNINEAGLLTGQPISTLAQAEAAVRSIHTMGSETVLVKRFRDGEQMIDLFYDGDTMHRFPTSFVYTKNTHGSGDSLSATIAASRAQGMAWADSVLRAQQFVARGLAASRAWQLGAGQGPISHFEHVAGSKAA